MSSNGNSRNLSSVKTQKEENRDVTLVSMRRISDGEADCNGGGDGIRTSEDCQSMMEPEARSVQQKCEKM